MDGWLSAMTEPTVTQAVALGRAHITAESCELFGTELVGGSSRRGIQEGRETADFHLMSAPKRAVFLLNWLLGDQPKASS
jgi:hypothetical protein